MVTFVLNVFDALKVFYQLRLVLVQLLTNRISLKCLRFKKGFYLTNKEGYLDQVSSEI